MPPELSTADRDDVLQKLAEIMDPATRQKWLDTPNLAFEGQAPQELLARGEIEPVRRAIYLLTSGEPSS